MAGGRVLALLAVVVLVAIAAGLVALAVMVRRLARVVVDTGRAVQQLSVAGGPTPLPVEPAAAGGVGAGSSESDGEWVVEVTDGVEADLPADHRPATGPRLSEVAAATLGPPLVRAAALGYGIRTVLADRSRPRPAPRRGLFGAGGGATGTRAERERARRRAARGRR